MNFVARIGAVLLVATCARPVVAQAYADASHVSAFDEAVVRAAAQLDAAAQMASRHHLRATMPLVTLGSHPAQAISELSLDRWLQSQLQRIGRERSTATQVRDLRDLARSLRRAASANGQRAPAADPQALALTILSQRAYVHDSSAPAGPPRATLLQMILKWLGERINDLIRALFGAAVAMPALGRIVVVAFIVVVAAAASYLIYLLVVTATRRQRNVAPNMGTPLAAVIEPQALYEQAKAAARAGQYAQAVALLFQASLRMLDGTGKLPYDASLTPGEYRRAVRRSIAVATDPFDQIAKTFVLAAFAERTITEHEFADADRAYIAMRPLLTA